MDEEDREHRDAEYRKKLDRLREQLQDTESEEEKAEIRNEIGEIVKRHRRFD